MAFSQADFDSLTTSIEWSIRQLEKPRKERVDAIKQFVTTHYGEGGAEKRVPTNFLELAATIYTRQLAPRVPKIMVTTTHRKLKPAATEMEIALNQVPKEVGMERTIQRSVVEGLFTMGIVKVGICASGKAQLGHDLGEPFVDVVSIDDYFVDMSASDYTRIQYEGNDYWAPLDEIANDDSYDTSEVNFPDDHTVVGEQGEERAEGVSAQEGGETYKKRIWLRDVWLPDSNELIIYAVKSQKLLKVISWDGPEGGPYRRLGFNDVPGNLLPLPPVALWMDLHELGNGLFRKMARAADAAKSVLGFTGGDDEAVRAFQAAKDGDGILWNGQKPETLTAGGVDNVTLAFYLQIRDLFSYFAGNLDSLGGLAPMTETVGQDKMLSEAASSRLRSMADRTRTFVQEIFGMLAWYEWTDPVRERVVEREIEGTDVRLRTVWSMETREGDFLDFNFDLDVYSGQDDSPAAKLQRINAIFSGYMVPMIPVLQAQGGTIDLQALFKLLAKLSDTPEIADIVKFVNALPQEDPIQGQKAPTRMPANTTRTYERVNRPGATRQGKDKALTQLLMGKDVQPAEGAALGRSTG